jgi:hypothetical protein
MSQVSEMDAAMQTLTPSVAADSSPTYWKVLKAGGKHRDHQWTVGLNVLASEFNDNPSDDCCPGRLYYCEQKDLIHWLSMGDYVVRVVEPIDDPEFRCITPVGGGGNKKGANRLVLTDERYSLHDIDTYHRLNIDLTKYSMNDASANGRVVVLQWWLDRSKDSGLELEYSGCAMYCASANGHVVVLQWWLDRSKDSGLELKYDQWVIYSASAHGHVDVLQWWLDRSKDSGLELKYDQWAMRSASANGHTAVVQWWKDSGLPHASDH